MSPRRHSAKPKPKRTFERRKGVLAVNRERLGAGRGKVALEAPVHAALAGVVQPHAGHAAVGGERAEGAVRERQRPGAGREVFGGVKLKGAVLKPAVGHLAAAPRLSQGRIRLCRALLGPGLRGVEVHDQRGTVGHGRDVGGVHAVHPTGGAEDGLEAVFGVHAVHAASGAKDGLEAVFLQQLHDRAPQPVQIVAAVARDEDEVALYAADAQQVLPADEVARRTQLAL